MTRSVSVVQALALSLPVFALGCQERPLPPGIGDPVPDMTFPVLHPGGSSYGWDDAVSLSHFEGRPVVLDVWASWCGPCRAIHKTVQGLAGEYQPQGVVFVGVQFQDRPANGIRWLERYGPEFVNVRDRDRALEATSGSTRSRGPSSLGPPAG